MLGHDAQRELGQPISEKLRDVGPAVSRRERTDQRDAHLHRGQKAARIAGQFQGHAGRAVALLGPLLQASAARGDNGDLGPGKKTVSQDQRQDNQDFDYDGRNGRRLNPVV